ncbi:MAG: chromate transporter [Lachnospiraceae bacterium]|nr:chromate transporter [Lachnospiraceae bacterium]
MIYLRLFWEFFKTGLFAVGGGLATLPFLNEMAEKTGWFTRSQLADMIAVSESTPGPIGVNMATYVGFLTDRGQGLGIGIPGAVVATLGLITPSVIVILIVARFLKAFGESKTVKNAFYGLRPASCAMIAAAGLGVAVPVFFGADILRHLSLEGAAVQWKSVILAAVLIILTRFVKKTKGLHPILFIAFAAVCGVVFHFAGI